MSNRILGTTVALGVAAALTPILLAQSPAPAPAAAQAPAPAPAAAQANPAQPAKRDVTKIYAELCASCHGPNMSGGQAPSSD